MPIPDILKHMTLAIYRQGSGGSKMRFQRAYDAAVSRLSQYGFITGSAPDFKLTPKGMIGERKHKKEGMKGSVKDKQFDAMFEWIQPHKDEKVKGQQHPDQKEAPGAQGLTDAAHTLGQKKKK
jgi:hypothetical protein